MAKGKKPPKLWYKKNKRGKWDIGLTHYTVSLGKEYLCTVGEHIHNFKGTGKYAYWLDSGDPQKPRIGRGLFSTIEEAFEDLKAQLTKREVEYTCDEV